MFYAMRIACNVAIQHGIEHSLGGLSLTAETAAFHEVGRGLKLDPMFTSRFAMSISS